MSKSYLSFLYLFISLSTTSFAQHHKLDSVVQTVKNTQYITSQKYDIKSKKVEIIRYKTEKKTNNIQNISRVQLQLDENNNELLNLSAFWNPENKTWDEEEKIEKEFNGNNELVRTTNHRKKNSKWVKDFENIKIYTKDSIIEIDYELSDGEFKPVHKNISVINSFGKINTHKIFTWDNEYKRWQQLTRTENEYQNDTILIGFETSKWEKNQWLKLEKVIYDLDKNRSKTHNYTTYKGNNTDWIPTYKFEQINAPKEQKQISQTSKWSVSDNKWIITSKIETYLNNEGKKQDVMFLNLDTSTHQLKLISEQLHLYDKKGRLNLFQEIDHSNQKIIGIQNVFKFDREGNVMQNNLFELDIENDTWKNKMTIEFSYYKNIKIESTPEIRKDIDLFGLNEYAYETNKNAIKQVKVYKYQNGKKVLYEEFEYFYSNSKG